MRLISINAINQPIHLHIPSKKHKRNRMQKTHHKKQRLEKEQSSCMRPTVSRHEKAASRRLCIQGWLHVSHVTQLKRGASFFFFMDLSCCSHLPLLSRSPLDAGVSVGLDCSKLCIVEEPWFCFCDTAFFLPCR